MYNDMVEVNTNFIWQSIELLQKRRKRNFNLLLMGKQLRQFH
jgi:hypothetical protein